MPVEGNFEYYRAKLMRDRANPGSRTPGSDQLELLPTPQEITVGVIGDQLLEEDRHYLALRDKSGRYYVIAVGSDTILAKLTARTEIDPNPGWGDSALTGSFDWVEMQIQADGVPVEKAGGRTGTHAGGDGAIELQFTNHKLEYGTGNDHKLVLLRKFPGTKAASNSYQYYFDEAHTNKDGPYTDV